MRTHHVTLPRKSDLIRSGYPDQKSHVLILAIPCNTAESARMDLSIYSYLARYAKTGNRQVAINRQTSQPGTYHISICYQYVNLRTCDTVMHHNLALDGQAAVQWVGLMSKPHYGHVHGVSLVQPNFSQGQNM